MSESKEDKEPIEYEVEKIIDLNFEIMRSIENDQIFIHDKGKTNIFGKVGKVYTFDRKVYLLYDPGKLASIKHYVCHETRDFSQKVQKHVALYMEKLIEINSITLYEKIWESYSKYDRGNNIIKEFFTNHVTYKNNQNSKESKERNLPLIIKYLVSMARSNMDITFGESFSASSQTCLCFVSDKQGIYKSTLAKMLNPCREFIYNFKVGGRGSAEELIALSRSAMAIIDDYTPKQQKELSYINDLITNESAFARKKYAVCEQHFLRRAAFCLTTNQILFINHTTATRRWLVYEIESIDIEFLKKNIKEFWGEIYNLAMNANFQHWLDKEDMDFLNIQNSAFEGNINIDDIIENSVFEIEKNKDSGEYVSNDFKTTVDINQYIHENYKIKITDNRQIGVAMSRKFPRLETVRFKRNGKRLTAYPVFFKEKEK